jgi:hypothetical protein
VDHFWTDLAAAIIVAAVPIVIEILKRKAPVVWQQMHNNAWLISFIGAFPTSVAVNLAFYARIVQEIDSRVASLDSRIEQISSPLLRLTSAKGPSSVAINIDSDSGPTRHASCPDGYFLASLTVTKVSGGNYAANSWVGVTGDCRKLIP